MSCLAVASGAVGYALGKKAFLPNLHTTWKARTFDVGTPPCPCLFFCRLKQKKKKNTPSTFPHAATFSFLIQTCLHFGEIILDSLKFRKMKGRRFVVKWIVTASACYTFWLPPLEMWAPDTCLLCWCPHGVLHGRCVLYMYVYIYIYIYIGCEMMYIGVRWQIG